MSFGFWGASAAGAEDRSLITWLVMMQPQSATPSNSDSELLNDSDPECIVM